MQIAFWTNVRGRAGNSSLCASIGSTIALEHRLNTVMINSSNHNSLLSLFGGYQPNNYNMGLSRAMSALHLARSDKLNAINIKNYCRTQVKNGGLDLFEDSVWCDNHRFKEEGDTYKKIIECLKNSYDVVCYDLGADEDNLLCNYIMEQSDLIIVSMHQDKAHWSNMIKHVKENRFLENNKTILYVVTKYDYRSRVKLSHIKRECGINPLTAIPYDVDFMDSCNEGKLIEFLLRTYKCGKEEENHLFISQIKELTDIIVDIKREAI